MPSHLPTVGEFSYRGFEVDEATGLVHCHYALESRKFSETICVGPGPGWGPAAYQAARLVYLLAGVSYYKAGAPPVVDLGETELAPGDADFLRHFYVEGLGEFAYRNELDLSGLVVTGGRAQSIWPSSISPVPAPGQTSPHRLLVPFGGGLDSIVTTELVKPHFDDVALFVLNRPGDRFVAIETAAAVTGLPVIRAERQLDDQILRSDELGFYNGHVPITGILSAIAVLAALVSGRDAVVMSNEKSASAGNRQVGERWVNHQWSKSLDFEDRFASALSRSVGNSVSFFSLLRAYSELWIAERFSHLNDYLSVFRSCNRAFAVDPRRRADRWCGTCDKCCFIDLILAPFVPVEELAAVFDGAEPLANPALSEQFRVLIGLSPDAKPWECVGDQDECQAAAVLAFERADRRHNALLAALVSELGLEVSAARTQATRLLHHLGPHRVPDALLPAALVG